MLEKVLNECVLFTQIVETVMGVTFSTDSERKCISLLE